FFFQAEDGIRDLTVTGVQTCALPILSDVLHVDISLCQSAAQHVAHLAELELVVGVDGKQVLALLDARVGALEVEAVGDLLVRLRSEERRVGKECRSGWSSDN